MVRSVDIPIISEFYGARANLKVAQNRFDVGFLLGLNRSPCKGFTHGPYIVNDCPPNQKPFTSRNSGKRVFPKSIPANIGPFFPKKNGPARWGSGEKAPPPTNK